MPINCNDVPKNPLVTRLLDGIDDWVSKESTIKNINQPYQAAISMFESRFNVPIEAAVLLGSKKSREFLGTGAIESFKSDLDAYVKRIEKGSIAGFESVEQFLLGTTLGKRDPVLAETLKSIRDIYNSDALRTTRLGKKYDDIIEKIRASGGISKRGLNKGLKEHRRLQLEYTKSLDSKDSNKIEEAGRALKDFESGGSVRDFVEFVQIIEDRVPQALQLKLEDEKRLADSGDKEAIARVNRYENGEELIKIKGDKENLDYLRRVGIDDSLIPAVRDYNDLMDDSYRTLRNGIDKKIDNIIKKIERRRGSPFTIDRLEELKENLRSKYMPRYSEGYFPHFTNELNMDFMDKVMPYFDQMETSQIDGKHNSLDIDDIISNLNDAIPSFGKSRTKETQYEYNKNFVDVVSTYIQKINQFNTNAFLTGSHMESLDKVTQMYGDEKGNKYANNIVSIIQSMYGSSNGDSRTSGSIAEIQKIMLSYQFFNKLGYSPRSALKNITQFLMNLPTFTTSGVLSSRKYLRENNLRLDVNRFLKESNLYMDTSEALLESGIKGKSADAIKIRRMNEKGEIVYSDEGSFVYKGLKIFSGGMSKLSQYSAFMHRGAENLNRRFTATTAFGQINKIMDESPRFDRYILDKIEKGELKGSLADIKGRYAKNYAKNMVILNHFDYESYAKAKAMKEGVGKFLFQFQHYGMEFLERNYSIYKETKYDLSTGWKEKSSTTFSDFYKDAKGVHKSMNMMFAYFIAPAIFSALLGYNQTLVEHVGLDFAKDLVLLFTSDFDDEEDRERINREFYGKGIVTSKLGPTVGTLIDVGVMTELINADNEYLNNLAFSVGEYTDDSNVEIAMQQLKLINGMLGRTADRYIPMYTRGHTLDAFAQEATFYPMKKDDPSVANLIVKPVIDKAFPNYYFDKLELKTKSRKKYGNLPVGLRNSLRYLEKEGKR